MEILTHLRLFRSRQFGTALTPFLLAITLLSGCYVAADPWEPTNTPSTPPIIERQSGQATGILEILSEPPGAEWFIGQTPHGTTPGKALDIPAGLHQITLKKTGFANWSVSIQVNPGETVHLMAPLQSNGQETIQSLAKAAEGYLHEKRFTMPKGSNALEKYQEILTIDPKNPLGWEGLKTIVDSFKTLSKEARATGQPKLAALRAQKAQRIQTLIDSLNPDKKEKPALPLETSESAKISTSAKVTPTQTDHQPLEKRPVPPKPTMMHPNRLTAEPVNKGADQPQPSKAESSQPEKTMTQSPMEAVQPPIPAPIEKKTEATTPAPIEKKTEATTSPTKSPNTTPKATPKSDNLVALRTQTEPVTGIEFVEIPAGCFQMGSDHNDPDEKPVHEVCLKSFWLARTEITNGQFRRYNPKHSSSSYAGRNLNGELQPVVNITWDDANKFAQWMSGRGGINFRLPTEAEWEYSARAGSTTNFPWGNEASEGCRYANVGDATAKKEWPKWNVFPCTDGYAETAPVGMFSPNAFGLYDMIGNVWEWVSDWYSPSYYNAASKTASKGPSEGFFRGARGGSWAVWPDYARSSNRTGIDPDHPDLHVGFRVVMMP